MIIEIREEHPRDIKAIREVNERAFGRLQEAKLVDKLRENCGELLSLVATIREQVVGHILFSPVVIEDENRKIEGMGLAPMAVLPEYQRRGIGSALVRQGLTVLAECGCPFIIVIGHPDYYPRFGFEPASLYSISSEWDVPDEAFMILIFDGEVLQDVSGTAFYRPEFSAVLEAD